MADPYESDMHKLRAVEEPENLVPVLDYEWGLGWEFVGTVRMNCVVDKDCFPKEIDYMVFINRRIT